MKTAKITKAQKTLIIRALKTRYEVIVFNDNSDKETAQIERLLKQLERAF